ncbi:MAG: TPM domain-containing protein [Ginsengibacter sp.]
MKPVLNPFNYLLIYLMAMSANCVGQSQDYNQYTNVAQTSAKSSAARNFKIPDPVGFVNDFENLFTEAEIKTLDSTIIAIHNKTSVQIAIITIDTNMINKSQVEEFTLQTFKSWGLQVDGQFNGILIGLSNAFKKLRIENGTGVEEALTDYEIKGIIETAFIPSLKVDKYYEGTINGLAAIMNKLNTK